MNEANQRLLEGRVAVVTGSGRGIGRAHALRMAAYGARVVVNDLGVAIDGKPTSETPADEVVGEIRAAGGEAVADRSDISTVAGGTAVVRRAIETWGRLDIVVNNAGIGRPRMVFNLEEQDWDDVLRVHLRGTFAVTREACRYWRSEGKAGRPVYGRVVNTSTGLLPMGGAGQSNYVAAKAGIAAFTAAVAQEMEPYLVTVNAIMPGARTRMASVGWRMDRLEGDSESRDPVHVAELVCYLASPSAGWISGQLFHVSGHRIVHAIPWTDRAELKRRDRGWTANDLVREFPRFFGAGPRPNEMPPKEWAERRAGGGGVERKQRE
ncbi:MAG TPA: SDR family NAD(P)-dependent oxidoreductase [Candidatus Bathyarchaeia archaeon]|nr:SDR family NAD(P)-dependent oxidoreductase [Candidatus Bathyarchaeia archaeon]